MLYTFSQIQDLFPSLNKRTVTWPMIRRACKTLGVEIRFLPLKLDGYYMPASDVLGPEIYISSRLSEFRQLATAVHEIKHAALDARFTSLLPSDPCTLSKLHKCHDDRIEFEAFAISSIAVIPQHRILQASRGLFDPADEFADDLWLFRKKILDTFGL